MKTRLPESVEMHRVRWGPLASTRAHGRNGVFLLPHPTGVVLCVVVSDGCGWEHVSVSLPPDLVPQRCPTWEEMCWVKDQFWRREECVIQYHPPESQYVSFHEHCLHLWRPINRKLPIPPSEFVGPMQKTVKP